MEQVRTFVAIELPEGLRQVLGTLQAGLKSHDQPWVKWVDPYGIHLTLKFLGNVAVDRLDDIMGAITEAAEGISCFHLSIRGLGVFPNPRRVQVAWVGLNGDVNILNQLQQRIESSLARLGFGASHYLFLAVGKRPGLNLVGHIPTLVCLATGNPGRA